MTARITFVTNTTQLYGAPRSLLLLLERLDRTRFEPAVLCPSEGPLVDRIRALGIQVVLGLSDEERERHARSGKLLGAVRFGPAYLRRLSRLLKDQGSDLVYLNTFGSTMPALVAWSRRLPVVVHVREARSYFAGLRNRVRRFPLLKTPRHWIAVSAAVQRLLVEHGAAEERISVVHNGVVPGDFTPDEEVRRRIRKEFGVGDEETLVGLVGAIERRKGVLDFVDACRMVQSRCSGPVRFVVVGGVKQPDYGAEVEARIAAHGLEGRLQRTGFRDDVASIYGALDVVANPTREEPFARVNLEAMASARPLVVTDVDGNPEAVEDGVSGLVVPPRDPESLATALVRLVDDAPLRKRMGSAARERAIDRFTADRYVDRVHEVLDRVLAG